MTIGQILRRWRIENDTTQVALAAILGISNRMLSHIERDKRRFPRRRISNLPPDIREKVRRQMQKELLADLRDAAA